jgi:hypothetical protein
MNPWIDFSIIIVIQFILFLAIAYKNNDTRYSLKMLPVCLLLGIPFGLLFDIVFGQYLDIYHYRLGFGVGFLIINGALSYGLGIATVCALRNQTFLYFYGWTVLIGALYELGNYFFPVWSWSFFPDPFIQTLILISAAYCGLFVLNALVLKITKDITFKFMKS